MLKKSCSRISLRMKATGLSLTITALALTVVATTGILQIRGQIKAAQERSADAVAMGMARAAELPLTVGDRQELGRLTASFLREENILFVAAYGKGEEPLGLAVRDQSAWDAYRRHQTARCVIGQRTVEGSAVKEEFSADAEADSTTATSQKIAVQEPLAVGRVVVGLSTASMIRAQREQIHLTIGATILAAVLGGTVLFLTLSIWLRRLQHLAAASVAIAEGDFSQSLTDLHDDEIGNLARAFEEMRQTLQERDRKLQKFTDTLQEQVHQRTQDLETALHAAEEASRTKSLFLANMSHELRTPLNGVIGMVDLLLAAGPNVQQRRYCDVAKTSARALLELINDILDFSKIEAGKLELDSTVFDLQELIEGVATMFGERASQKQIELVCGVAKEVPPMVNGDPVRLRQVLTNLVSNALKFTERGEVVISVSVAEQTAEHALVRFNVKDSGIGIPADRVPRLFRSFSQVDASTTRKFGGTGLGLAISQRIAEMMGGKIGVDSEEGKGSTFWVTARLEKRDIARPKRRDTQFDPRGLRVLAVDDNTTNREIIRTQLESWLLRADVASSAKQAMELLHEASSAGDPYRFAILDMHMPEVDGATLARQIKADPATKGVLLISLSSIGDHISPQMMEQLGFSACLTKPAVPSFLYDSIVDCLASDKPRGKRDDWGIPLPVKTLRLDGGVCLLAEDNEINRMVASELLEQAGAVCEIAVDGREALDKALQRKFDFILMDCQMPELDGFEATRKLREAEAAAGDGYRRIVIALTANAIKGDRELCLAAGMDGYVTKPIDPAELLRTIHELVPAMRPGTKAKTVNTAAAPSVTGPERVAVAPGAPAPAAPAPMAFARVPMASTLEKDLNPPVASSPAMPVDGKDLPIDVLSLQQRCMGNRKLAAKALSKFETLVTADIASLEQSIRDGSAKSLASTAHKIKGAAGNISAEGVRRIAAELEILGKEARLETAQQSLEHLCAEVDRFRQYLSVALADLGASAPAAGEVVVNTQGARNA
jgi:signal transduction histidine kinase/DNA-binding response OmpR family regulator/HPt (histidine-containing phosphotransfer) domain-containing protein